MKVPILLRDDEPATFADAQRELVMEMRRVARGDGREILAYLDELLTADDVAQLLGVEVQSVYRWASDGCGPRRVKLGGGDGPVRYRRGDVREWIASRTVDPAKPAPRRRSRRACGAERNGSRHQAATADSMGIAL